MADAQLTAVLKLDDTQFKRGVQDAEQSATGMKQGSTAAFELGNVMGVSLKAGAAAAVTAILAVGAASATAFISFKNEAKRAAEILNTAFRLNVNTDDLQAIEYAAKTVGLESENVRDILKDVNDRMGDIAINGGGEMVDIFKALNLDVEKFIGKDPISVVTAISDALKTASTQQKTQAFEAMGNDLSFMLPLLYEMDVSLSDAMQTARDLGAVISNVDLNAYHEFNQQLDEATTKISNMKTIVFANLAEPMQEVISYINEMIQEAGGFEQVANDIANSVVEGIVIAVEAAEFLAQTFNVIAGIVEAIVGGLALVGRGILEIVEFATKMPGTPLWFADKDGAISRNIESMQNGLDGMISKARTYDEIIEDVANKNTKASQISDGIKSRLEKGREKMNSNHAAKLEAPKLESEVQKLEQALNDATKAFVEAQAAGKDASAEFAAKKAAQEALDTAKSKLTDVNKQLNPRNFGQNDAGSTKEQYLSGQLLDEQKQHAKELDKQQKDLLRQQQQSQKDNARLENDAARLQQDNTRADKQSSEVMRQAVDTFARTADGKTTGESNGGMSFYSSSGNGGGAGQSAANMQNLGVLYIASQDGKQMAQVLATPDNVRLIKQIAVQGVNEMVRDGAAANT